MSLFSLLLSVILVFIYLCPLTYHVPLLLLTLYLSALAISTPVFSTLLIYHALEVKKKKKKKKKKKSGTELLLRLCLVSPGFHVLLDSFPVFGLWLPGQF